MNGYSWQIKNTRLFLRLSSSNNFLKKDNSCILSLMINHKEAKNNCKIVTSFIGSDPFGVGENAMKFCEDLNEKCDFILDLLDKDEYEIKETNKWWFFPSREHDVEADFIINFMTYMKFNDMNESCVNLLHCNEKHNYCACISRKYKNDITDVSICSLPNGIKSNAVNNLRVNVLAIKLYLDKINKAVFENVMCDNDNPECLIENNFYGNYSIEKQGVN